MQKARLYRYTLIIQALLWPLTNIIIFLFSSPSSNLIYKLSQSLFGTVFYSHAPSVLFLLVPAFYFLLSLLGAVITISIVSADRLPSETANDELENRKWVRKQNFWRFSFYTNTIMAGCALACFFVMLSQGMQHLYYTYAGPWRGLFTWDLAAAAGIITSFILGGLLLGVSALWQTSKAASLLNICVALIIFLLPFVINGVWLFSAPVEKQGFDQIDTGSQSEEHQESEEETAGEEFEEEEIVSDYLSSLWDNPSEDRENVIGAMNYLLHESGAKQPSSAVDIVRYNLPLEKDIPEDAKGAAGNCLKIANYIRRDGGKLKAAFNSYKPILYMVVTSDIYYQSAPQRMVNGLIASYQDIHDRNDEESVWLEIYDVMKDGERPHVSDYYDDLKAYISEDVLKIFTTKNPESVEADAVWAYSFWARRYKEGNSREVYDILLEIQQHYETN